MKTATLVLALIVATIAPSPLQGQSTAQKRFSPAVPAVAGNFTVPLGVYDAQIYDTLHAHLHLHSVVLTFGTDAGATACFDSAEQEVALPPFPPNGVFDARFTLPCGGDPSESGSRIDVRLYTVSTQVDTFLLSLQSAGGPVTIVWPDLGTLYAGPVLLRDVATGGLLVNVDMKSQTSCVVDADFLTELVLIADGPIGDHSPSLAFPPPHPMSVALDGDSVLVQWNRRPFELRYDLELSNDPLFLTTLFEDSSFVDPSKRLGPLDGETHYYSRVRAVTQLGFTDWSPILAFSTGPDSVHVPVLDRWNIVSTPVFVQDMSPSALFPTASTGAFSYTPGGYETVTAASAGAGYWMRFEGSQDLVLSGSTLEAFGVPVAGGWNMVGSISKPVPAASIVTDGTALLSPFYRYEAGYSSADTLFPGQGYWIKTTTGGYLVFDATATAATSAVPRADLNHFSSLIVEDAAGQRQSLYYGPSSVDEGEAAGLFPLPPPPPLGAFDVRFETGTLAERAVRSATSSVPIVISSARYPVKLRWDENDDPRLRTALIVNGEKVPMRGSGSLVVETRSDLRLRLAEDARDGEVPNFYALGQNYPNPFNPSTTIRYALPATSAVRLEVFDLLGRRLALLVDEQKAAGQHEAEWVAPDVASGIYYYRLTASDVRDPSNRFTQVRKMLLLR